MPKQQMSEAEAFVEECRQTVSDWPYADLKREYLKLQQQFDELLAACKELVLFVDSGRLDEGQQLPIRKLSAAIAAAEGRAE